LNKTSSEFTYSDYFNQSLNTTDKVKFETINTTYIYFADGTYTNGTWEWLNV